ncbi:MAG: type II toxin-antitoxin system prevent-host-death family antitoxin [Spirochaetales bacterium]|nr:type II toxin-antitoxin system prevent-host-death family antitoxin [Spirochaetales bacterium]MBE7439189.1 type II toxin-antitoxin system prevent-host-death family antitoxin [Spirochaetales bacterium]
MKTIELATDSELNRQIRSVRREPIILTRNGKPVAAIVDLPNTDAATAALGSDPTFKAIIERSRKQVKKKETISLGSAKRYLQKKNTAHAG